MDDGLAELRHAVAGALGGTGWTVTPLPGSSGRTFLVGGPRRLVLRFAETPAVLERLGELGVAPPVVAAGEVEGRRFVLQSHVDSPALDGAWIAAHQDAVARVLAVVAGDAGLAGMARPLTPESFVAHLLALAAPLDGTAAPPGYESDLAATSRLIAELGSMAAALGEVPSVASHGDPNASNFLWSGDGLRLIDWDDLRRADPLRDLGQVAWWYLPEHDWPAFMAIAGTRWDAAVERRMTWWVAAESVDVAVRLWSTDPEAAAAFVRDAEAAVGGRPNPRRE